MLTYFFLFKQKHQISAFEITQVWCYISLDSSNNSAAQAMPQMLENSMMDFILLFFHAMTCDTIHRETWKGVGIACVNALRKKTVR